MTGPRLLAGLASLLLLHDACGAAFGQAAEESPQAVSNAGSFLPHVPLASLKATREHPLFIPSRHPASAAPAPVIFRQPAPAPVEEPPRLTLLGIIRNPDGATSAVVMDESDRTSLSLKAGDNRRGWVVRSIDGATVTLQKQERTTQLAFPNAQPSRLLPAN